jgi:thiol-disulfide isomerase/thioredoxin
MNRSLSALAGIFVEPEQNYSVMPNSTRFFFLLLFFLSTAAQAQQAGRSIRIRVQGAPDSTMYLSHYLAHLGDRQIVRKDTARADARGLAHFQGSDKLPEGLYVVQVGENWKFFQLLIDADQDFEISTDTTNFITRTQVTGSVENALFYEFNQKLGTLSDGARAAQKTDPAATQRIQQEMNAYRKGFMKQHAGTFLVKILRAASDPEVPPAPKLANGRPDSLFAYRYYKAHFFDNLDLADERLLRTPFLGPKLDFYFENLVPQQPDSLIREADRLMARAKGTDMRRFCAYKLSSMLENTKVLGLDAAFVHMGERYYVAEPALWDTSTVRRYAERVAILKPLLPGKKLPNLLLTDTTGRVRPLHDVKATYTIVYLYADDCGHCREATPKLKAFYEKNRAKGLAIYAANVNRDPKRWREFIREFGTQSAFINVIDSQRMTDFQQQFDAYSTPMVYVLDRDKKIIARRLPVEELDKYFEFMQRQQATAKVAK